MEDDQRETGKKRKKHVSKKSKRSWRKHTDIKDIEEHLDEVRRQERLGGLLSVKEDKQLFFVDKDSKDAEKDTTNGEVKRLRKRPKTGSRVYKESFIEPIVGRKRKSEKHSFKEENEDEYSSEEEEEKPKKIRENEELKSKSYDLWDVQETKTGETVGTEHYLKATKKINIKQPKTAYQVKSSTPAIAVCHPGASYNPTVEEHQSLLMTACRVEIVKEKEIQKIERSLRLPSAEELAKLPSYEEEMSQGLFDGPSAAEENESSSDENEELELLPCSKTRPRKLAKEKRKENERKKEEQNVQTLRKEKLKENEVFRIKNLKKQIRHVNEKRKELKMKREAKKTQAALKPQRLGKLKFEEMNIEIQLTDELSGSLRSLKPEGNLFVDRYKSLQRRNIIEPRKIVVPHRKYGLKEYEKRTFKNYNLQEKLKEMKKK